ncbi:MAG: serine--tRNA ligase, partial [Gemmatimonadetes bacterium]|nr:serine--tRNA ligase [Gemmatimonadota bacterium]
MLDIRLVRDRLEELRAGMARRGKLAELAPVLDRAEALERERREAITELEARQAERNRITQEVAQRRKAGGDAADLIAAGRAVGEAIASLEARRAEAEAAVQAMMLEFPNLT